MMKYLNRDRLNWARVRPVAIGILLAIVLVMVWAAAQFVLRQAIGQWQASQVTAGLESDKQALRELSEQVSQQPEWYRKLSGRDERWLGGALDALRAEHQLGFAAIVGPDGFVVARSPMAFGVGDNLFQTTYSGRRVAQGESYAAVSEGRIAPLVVAAGAPILDDQQVVGGMFIWFINSLFF